jgi:hypothetical protein
MNPKGKAVVKDLHATASGLRCACQGVHEGRMTAQQLVILGADLKGLQMLPTELARLRILPVLCCHFCFFPAPVKNKTWNND